MYLEGYRKQILAWVRQGLSDRLFRTGQTCCSSLRRTSLTRRGSTPNRDPRQTGQTIDDFLWRRGGRRAFAQIGEQGESTWFGGVSPPRGIGDTIHGHAKLPRCKPLHR